MTRLLAADSGGISIWRILITILTAPMRLIFGIFPSVNLPFFSDGDTSAAHSIGERLAVVNAFMPIGEALQLAAVTLGIIFPMAGVYIVGNWIWRHIPTILGVGTGAG